MGSIAVTVALVVLWVFPAFVLAGFALELLAGDDRTLDATGVAVGITVWLIGAALLVSYRHWIRTN